MTGTVLIARVKGGILSGYARLANLLGGNDTEHWLLSLLGPRVSLLAPVLFGANARKKFYRDLTHLLRSGLSFQEAIHELAKNMKDNTFIYNNMLANLAEGQSPADAMSNWVPSSERLLIKAAERNKDKKDVIEMIRRLISIMENSGKISSALWDALLQPVLLFYATIGTFVWVANTLVDKVIVTMNVNPAHLPPKAHFYYKIFHFLQHTYGWGSVVLISILLPLWIALTIGKDFPLRKYFDKMPPWSLYKLIVGAGFLYSMASLLQAKTPLRSALVDLWRQSDGWLKSRIGSTLENLNQDGLLSNALEASGDNFPDKEIISRLKLRESRGDLGQALHEFSLDWTEDGLEAVKKSAQVLNYVAWGVMGTAIGGLASGVQAIQNAAMALYGGPGF